MTRGKNHETESLDDIIGLWLERKKSSFKLGHLLSKHLFQMYCALSSPLLPLSQERVLRAVRDRSLRNPKNKDIFMGGYISSYASELASGTHLHISVLASE